MYMNKYQNKILRAINNFPSKNVISSKIMDSDLQENLLYKLVKLFLTNLTTLNTFFIIYRLNAIKLNQYSTVPFVDRRKNFLDTGPSLFSVQAKN